MDVKEKALCVWCAGNAESCLGLLLLSGIWISYSYHHHHHHHRHRRRRQRATMPIAPITGKLRKRLWLDLSTALGLGTAGGYYFWLVLRVHSQFRLYLNYTAVGMESISNTVRPLESFFSYFVEH